MPPDGPDSWPKGVSKKQWLVFYRIDGMSMQGGGLIDGKGEKWWNLPCKPHKVIFLIPFYKFDFRIFEFVYNVRTSMQQGINGTTLPGPCDSPVVSKKNILLLSYIFFFQGKDIKSKVCLKFYRL